VINSDTGEKAKVNLSNTDRETGATIEYDGVIINLDQRLKCGYIHMHEDRFKESSDTEQENRFLQFGKYFGLDFKNINLRLLMRQTIVSLQPREVNPSSLTFGINLGEKGDYVTLVPKSYDPFYSTISDKEYFSDNEIKSLCHTAQSGIVDFLSDNISVVNENTT